MGQMTHGVLFGVKMDPPKELGEDGWHELIHHYKNRAGADGFNPASPYSEDFRGIGFWCAVGASGEPGVPDLCTFPLGDFAGASVEYEEQLNKAREAWVRFATWCSTEHSGTVGTGKWKRAWKTPAIAFAPPTLYLVETEVS